ncbi:MAG: PilZ domain-containing protein [Bauldia sp.]|nr:PilZ domain-containing protein [Bauldia sp.]
MNATSSGDSGPAERRQEPRPRALKAARLLFGGFNMSFDCQIRNLSAHGARLLIEGNLSLPNDFYLYVVGDAVIAHVRATWRTSTEMGVQFLEPLVAPARHPDHRVNKLQLYRI